MDSITLADLKNFMTLTFAPVVRQIVKEELKTELTVLRKDIRQEVEQLFAKHQKESNEAHQEILNAIGEAHEEILSMIHQHDVQLQDHGHRITTLEKQAA